MLVFISVIPKIILKWLIPSYIWLSKYSPFRSVTLLGVELPHPLQMSIQLRKLHLLIQHFMILQLRHATFITQSLKEIHSGRETGLIDTGPLYQNIAIIISTKCVNDHNCTFNTDSLDRKHSFFLQPSALSYDVNWWHDKSLHIIPVNTSSATFIQE